MDRHSAVQSRTSAPLASLADVPNNLPDQLTSFIGRSAELAQIRELISETRLLTLGGTGGCGKTRLALRSAAESAGRFPGGVWWVELAALEDPALLPTAVTSALGLHERPGAGPLEALLEHLRDRRLLLVVDNCEHLLAPCATLVDELLRSCSGLVVLCTSREALRLSGERTYRVPSLNLPSEGSTADVTQSDAVRLFVDRAIQARRTFAVSEDNAGAVAAICRALDGIPLAIELAAARVRMLSPQRIASELDDRFRLLIEGDATVAPRHQTLRASIQWSDELCSERERTLLRRLSVFTGGWTLDAAEAVGAGEALERRAILNLMTSLLDKSLIDTEERDGEIRFSMLETIRQYAAERLIEAGEVEGARARHLAWCLDLAERAEPELVRRDARTWLARLEPEEANLRAALDWAIAGDGETALRLAGALTFFWVLGGRLEEGVAALARALEVALEPSAPRGKVLWGLAYLSIWRGQFKACLDYATRALADAEAEGDRRVMARALNAQGLVISLKDHLQRRPLERSLELAREAGDEWCTADGTRLLGATYTRQSEHELARPILEDSYALSRALGHRPLEAWYFNMRAWGELEHGRLPAARGLAEQAATVSGEVGDPVPLGLATSLLVECDVLQGKSADGRARGEPCLERMRRLGVGPAQNWLAFALALVDVAEGYFDAATARLEAHLRTLEAGPSYEMVSKARRRLAVALLLSGDTSRAEGEAQRVLSDARRAQNEHGEAIARHILGRTALARGAALEAEAHLHEALAIAVRRDFRLQTVNSLESLAHVAAITEGPTEATRLLAAVRAARDRLGTARWPPELQVWTRVEHGVHSKLGDDAFAVAWSEGLALSLDEAVKYVSRTRGERKRPKHGWESLTPTELEVVRHAASGLTNPQIGERMFISRGTVKAHLSHIFAKLGTSSRSELAGAAAKRGLDDAPGAPAAPTQ